MALDFLSGIFGGGGGGGGGGGAAPMPFASTADIYGQAAAMLPQFAQANLAYNQALQPGITALQLASEAQQDPRLRPLIQATTGSILDELSLGTQISPDIQADLTRQLLESGAASGFGVSPAGRGRVISQTASERERIGQARRAQALSAIPTLRSASPYFEPRETFGMQSALAGDLRAEEQANRAQAAIAAEQEEQRGFDFKSLLSSGLQIAGTAFGTMYGGPIGAQIGGAAGGFLGNAITGGKGKPVSGDLLSGVMGMFGKGGMGPVGGGIGGGR